jgi:hypothetical protein
VRRQKRPPRGIDPWRAGWPLPKPTTEAQPRSRRHAISGSTSDVTGTSQQHVLSASPPPELEQPHIRRPHIYTDGTICYGMRASIEEGNRC